MDQATPWGYPAQPDQPSWIAQYGPLLLIGVLLVIGLATSGEVGREKRRVKR